jgi:hypothetical protein
MDVLAVAMILSLSNFTSHQCKDIGLCHDRSADINLFIFHADVVLTTVQQTSAMAKSAHHGNPAHEPNIASSPIRCRLNLARNAWL